ncbi:hypothetical protein E2C01_020422 [Portunus trituberculatus]|uniref:Uncharacterized protein n=1 Tax=Portunus trituberculatus TaxID=210409 RepID=A0A5B7E345_PORTR|nr:hypothetical protein [Portunus trituberculatus]
MLLGGGASRRITQDDRLLNTPAPLLDKTRTAHSPTLPRSLFKTITASAAACLPSLKMPPKRPATSPAMSPSVAKTRKSLTLKVKLDVIHRYKR